jgi:tetratricopeptide (TPR) repeat protein
MFKKQPSKVKEQDSGITLRAGDSASVPEPAPDEAASPTGKSPLATDEAESPTGKSPLATDEAAGANNLHGTAAEAEHSQPAESSHAAENPRPIKGARASQLSDEDLLTIATRPESIEADWMPAFTELDKRSKTVAPTTKSGRPGKIVLLIVAATAALCAGTAIFCVNALQQHGQATGGAAMVAVASYPMDEARVHSRMLRERAVIRLEQALESKGWATGKTASYLGVTPESIEALMHCKDTPFSLSELNTMLTAMGASTAFPDKPEDKEVQQTIAYWTRAIALNPQAGLPYARRYNAYEAAGQYDLAIADLKRLMDGPGDHIDILQTLASLYYDAGRNQEALSTINTLLKRCSTNAQPNHYANRARIYLALGNIDKAIDDATHSISLMKSQRLPDPYFTRALAYEKLGKNKEALSDLKKVLEIDPRNSKAEDLISKLGDQ